MIAFMSAEMWLKSEFFIIQSFRFISRWISGAFTFADPFVVSGEPAAGFDLAACRSFVAFAAAVSC